MIKLHITKYEKMSKEDIDEIKETNRGYLNYNQNNIKNVDDLLNIKEKSILSVEITNEQWEAIKKEVINTF